ncbi:MAG: hypothetical protein ACRC8K_03950 [Waterburya sp.]
MKEVKISTFKAQCLSLLDEVGRTKEGLTVTCLWLWYLQGSDRLSGNLQ